MQPWKVQVYSYLTGAWHYRWIGIFVAWLVCLAGWAGVALMPNQFEANAKIYVDTDTMMGPLLKGLAVNSNPEQQVAVMLATLLTRPNLEQVVHLTNRPGKYFSSAELARQVASIHGEVSVKGLPTRNLFEVAVTDKDPNKALSIAQTLLSIFVDLNVGNNHRDYEGAQSFLDDKVAEYERLVRQAEQRQAAFRQANLDILSNTLTPVQARGEIDKARDELGSAQARVGSLQAQLKAVPKILYVDAPGPLVVSSGTTNTATVGKGESLFQRLAEAKQALIDLKSRYTEDFPDVRATEREVKQLETELASTPSTGAMPTGNQSIPNPIYVQTQSKLSDALTEVAFQQHKYDEAVSNLEKSEKLTSQAIEVNAKFSDLDRDYDVLHKTYQDLLSRRESARISQSVNDEQSAVDVRVVEPPKKAPFPTAPNRPLLNSVVLLAGLAAGAAAAFALSLNAGRFFAKEQLISAFDYPVIGVVSRLSMADDTLKVRRSFSLMAASLVVLLFGYAGVLVVFDATFRGMLRSVL